MESERKLERYQYAPGAFLFESDRGGDTPVADDRGAYRTDDARASSLAQSRLDAARDGARIVTFETSAADLAPGSVVSILDHPRTELAGALLVVSSNVKGSSEGARFHQCEARAADHPHRPLLSTPKPRIAGVERATVVGPPEEEIYVDELGRVRVYFHWDRSSEANQRSSCWIHVSHAWAGTGFGAINLPRIGQEVLVDFLGGDPDRPIITGRVYTKLQQVPYKLPEHNDQALSAPARKRERFSADWRHHGHNCPGAVPRSRSPPLAPFPADAPAPPALATRASNILGPYRSTACRTATAARRVLRRAPPSLEAPPAPGSSSTARAPR